MEQLNNLWNSGTGGKVVIIAVPILVMICGCCLILYALGSFLPDATPTPIPTRIVPTAQVATYTPMIALPSATMLLATTVAPAVVPTEVPTATTAPTAEAPVVAPTEAPPAASITLIDLTSPVHAGGNATLRIQTTPGVTCRLAYTTPSGNESTADGLGQTVADGSGICAWTWDISPGTNPGTGRLRVTVNGMSQTFEIVIQ